MEGAISVGIERFYAKGETSPAEKEALLRVGIFDGGGNRDILIENCKMTTHIIDHYIFCASTEPDQKLSSEGQQIFEISELDKFAAELSKAAPDILKTPIVRRVEYLDRIGDAFASSTPRLDAFHKDPKFSFEKEVRILWNGAPAVDEFRIICAPNASKFIKRIA